MAVNPRKILGLDLPVLEAGKAANFVVFDTDSEWTFNEKTNKSKSSNSPFMGSVLKGRVSMVCNNNKLSIF